MLRAVSQQQTAGVRYDKPLQWFHGTIIRLADCSRWIARVDEKEKVVPLVGQIG